MRDEFWELLEEFLPFFRLLFAVNVVLLLMLLLTFPFQEPGTASYYISFASLGFILFVLAGTFVLIRTCRAHRTG